MKEAIFGGGCFWCLDAAFRVIDGVKGIECGYANGNTPNPTYKEVCTDTTGFAEVVKITFDESKISYEKLLELFFLLHDPTTLNRQGNDFGSQYRSIIITLDKEQKEKAKEYIATIEKNYPKKIVTKVEPLKNYYKAEEYHQNYFAKNPEQSYCQFIVLPKVIKAAKWQELKK